MSKDEVKEAILSTLVEPPGQLDKEIVEQCKGLLRLETESKKVRLADVKLSEKERVTLYCLGKRLLAYLLDDPSISDVTREELQEELGIDAKAISAYASVLIERERLLERDARGSYRVRLQRMPSFLSKLRQKVGG